jgi:predicted nucleotide-binding protein (sugar kinase/HSP70/actin superfamily)
MNATIEGVRTQAKKLANNTICELNEAHFTNVDKVKKNIIPQLEDMVTKIIAELLTESPLRYEKIDEVREIIELFQVLRLMPLPKTRDEFTRPFEMVLDLKL